METNVQLNKWEGLFESFLDLTEFSLEYHKDTKDWGLYDRQGGNLGDIQSDRFKNAGEIFDRMTVYIDDYFYRDLEEEIDAYKVKLPSDEILAKKYGNEINWGGTAYWLAVRAELGSGNKFVVDHVFEFDVLDMIANHFEEINLHNVYHEEV